MLVHLFSYRVNRGAKGCKTYVVCGVKWVHTDTVTSDVALVTCPTCKEALLDSIPVLFKLREDEGQADGTREDVAT